METYRKSMKAYKWAAEEMPKAMKNNDEAKMNEGGEKIDNGNQLMIEATEQAQDLRDNAEQ